MFKKVILRIFTYTAILYVVTSLIHGFTINSLGSTIVFALILTAIQFIIRPVVHFLTLPINFLTFGLFAFAFSCFVLYALNLVIPGFVIKSGYIDGASLNIIKIQPIMMNKYGVLVVSCILIAFLNGIVNWTVDKEK